MELTSERVNSNFLPDFERLFNILFFNALYSKVSESGSHRVPTYFHCTDTFLAVFSNKVVRMGTVWKVFSHT